MNVSKTAPQLPRWCPLCPTNGYHKPENCPYAKAKVAKA